MEAPQEASPIIPQATVGRKRGSDLHPSVTPETPSLTLDAIRRFAGYSQTQSCPGLEDYRALPEQPWWPYNPEKRWDGGNVKGAIPCGVSFTKEPCIGQKGPWLRAASRLFLKGLSQDGKERKLPPQSAPSPPRTFSLSLPVHSGHT